MSEYVYVSNVVDEPTDSTIWNITYFNGAVLVNVLKGWADSPLLQAVLNTYLMGLEVAPEAIEFHIVNKHAI